MAQIHNVEHLDSHTVVVDSHTDLVQDIHIESVADNPDIDFVVVVDSYFDLVDNPIGVLVALDNCIHIVVVVVVDDIDSVAVV